MRNLITLVSLFVVMAVVYGCSGESTPAPTTTPTSPPAAATSTEKASGGGGMPPPAGAPDPTK